jgi:hypothetical protein
MNEISEPSAPGRYESTVPGVPGRDERSVPGVPHSSLPLAPDRDGRSLPRVKYCRVESSLAGVVRTRYLVRHVGMKIVCQVEQCPWCARGGEQCVLWDKYDSNVLSVSNRVLCRVPPVLSGFESTVPGVTLSQPVCKVSWLLKLLYSLRQNAFLPADYFPVV